MTKNRKVLTLEDLEDETGMWVFPCDCQDHNHGLVITRLDDSDHPDLVLEIKHYPRTLLDRIKDALNVLRYGYIDAGEFILSYRRVDALIHTLRRAAPIASTLDTTGD